MHPVSIKANLSLIAMICTALNYNKRKLSFDSKPHKLSNKNKIAKEVVPKSNCNFLKNIKTKHHNPNELAIKTWAIKVQTKLRPGALSYKII